MNYVHLAALIALGCLSVFHAMLAIVMFDEITFRVVWYLGVDLGVAAVIAVNALALRQTGAGDPTSWAICHGVNTLNLAYAAFYYFVVPDPGTALAFGVDIALLIAGVQSQRLRAQHAQAKQW
jgi:hypothetical protein